MAVREQQLTTTAVTLEDQIARARDSELDWTLLVEDRRKDVAVAVEAWRSAVQEHHRAGAYLQCLKAWRRELEGEAI
jgi:hypothetical protein